MKVPAWRQRFLTSTRGRIISLLRRAERTANELAEILSISDNAVRVHLSALERDGLVQQNGTRPSIRKPNLTYRLTAEAEQMFHQAFGPLLCQTLAVLIEHCCPEELEMILTGVGRRIAMEAEIARPNASLRQRLLVAQSLLEEWGGQTELEESGDRLFIRSYGCPVTIMISDHPQSSRIVESMMTEILGVPVTARYQQGSSPHCLFEILTSQERAAA